MGFLGYRISGLPGCAGWCKTPRSSCSSMKFLSSFEQVIVTSSFSTFGIVGVVFMCTRLCILGPRPDSAKNRHLDEGIELLQARGSARRLLLLRSHVAFAVRLTLLLEAERDSHQTATAFLGVISMIRLPPYPGLHTIWFLNLDRYPCAARRTFGMILSTEAG